MRTLAQTTPHSGGWLLERICPVEPFSIVPRILAGGCPAPPLGDNMTEKRSLHATSHGKTFLKGPEKAMVSRMTSPLIGRKSEMAARWATAPASGRLLVLPSTKSRPVTSPAKIPYPPRQRNPTAHLFEPYTGPFITRWRKTTCSDVEMRRRPSRSRRSSRSSLRDFLPRPPRRPR